MAPKLSPRQQAQLAWLDTLPQRLERLTKIIELMAVGQADDTQVRAGLRLADQLKAQAGGVGVAPLAEAFGHIGAILRRTGGTQIRVRGLRELMSGVRINADGARRAAATAIVAQLAEDGVTSS